MPSAGSMECSSWPRAGSASVIAIACKAATTGRSITVMSFPLSCLRGRAIRSARPVCGRRSSRTSLWKTANGLTLFARRMRSPEAPPAPRIDDPHPVVVEGAHARRHELAQDIAEQGFGAATVASRSWLTWMSASRCGGTGSRGRSTRRSRSAPTRRKDHQVVARPNPGRAKCARIGTAAKRRHYLSMSRSAAAHSERCAALARRQLVPQGAPPLQWDACEFDGNVSMAHPMAVAQPERDVNCEGRKRAEKGQKMADGTKRVHNFLCNIRMLGWLTKAISRSNLLWAVSS